MKDLSDAEKLSIQFGLMNERKTWNDATHLEKEYERNQQLFLSNIVEFGIMLNLNIEDKQLRNGQFYDILDQNNKPQHADITRSDHQGEADKLISFLPFNEKTNATARFLYSPNYGIKLEYAADFMKGNKTFGHADYFGSAIQTIIENISMSSSKVSFDTHVQRYTQAPYGLERFYVISKGFMDKETMLDAFGVVGTLDALVRGMHLPHAVGGTSFNTPYDGEQFKYCRMRI